MLAAMHLVFMGWGFLRRKSSDQGHITPMSLALALP